MSNMFPLLIPITRPEGTLQRKDSIELIPENGATDAESHDPGSALSNQLETTPPGAAADSAVRPSVEDGNLENGSVQAPTRPPSFVPSEEQSLREQLLDNDSLGG